MGDRVCDWMTRDPASAREDASALEAFDGMVEGGIRHLPVVDAGGRVIGIVSIDDLRGAFPFDVGTVRPLDVAERDEARTYSVSDVMTWAPQTARASGSLEEAVRRMAAHRIGCLPVVDEADRLEGILSETDALHALDALLRRERSAVPTGARRAAESPVETLWAERERLVEQLARWEDAQRALSSGSDGGPHDRAASAADEEGVADLELLGARAARRLRAIERALERAEEGRFGICEHCQGRIPASRLRALPEATRCVHCARVTARASWYG